MIKCDRERFSGLVYDGDWHARLIHLLALAKDDTKSPEIQAAITTLQKLLQTKDECVHAVTVRKPAPTGIDPVFIASCLKEEPWSADSVGFEEGGIMAVTITHRGSWDNAYYVAERCVNSAMDEVMARIGKTKTQGFVAPAQMTATEPETSPNR